MANTLVSVFKNTQCIVGLTTTIVRQARTVLVKPFGIRHLYSSTTIGIDGYVQQKERTKSNLFNIATRFREKMSEYSSNDSKNMVFTEDLKNMLHLAEGDSDVKLSIQMMKKFNQQNKQMRFGNFVFGPVVMRMFHFLNKPVEAFECFKDQDLDGMFDQVMSYQILLDLLFENRMYNEMLEAFTIIQSKQIEGIKYAKNVIVLVCAACYKLNTDESLQYVIKLWSELQGVGHLPMRRAVTFSAALAINQGKPNAALEMLGMVRNSGYTTVRNLKASAFVDIGRIEEAISLLKSIITEDGATVGPVPTFNCDVINKIKDGVEKLGNSEITAEFNRVLKYFQEQGHLSDETLDSQLCKEITPPQLIGNKINENFSQQQPRFSRFNRDNATRNRQQFEGRTIGGRFQRPGLSDL